MSLQQVINRCYIRYYLIDSEAILGWIGYKKIAICLLHNFITVIIQKFEGFLFTKIIRSK